MPEITLVPLTDEVERCSTGSKAPAGSHSAAALMGTGGADAMAPMAVSRMVER